MVNRVIEANDERLIKFDFLNRVGNEVRKDYYRFFYNIENLCTLNPYSCSCDEYCIFNNIRSQMERNKVYYNDLKQMGIIPIFNI